MRTTAEDLRLLGICAAAVAVGALVIGIGVVLDPVRFARHAWRNR